MFVRRSILVVLGLLAVLLSPIGGSPAYAAGTVVVSVQGQGSVTGDGINCTQTGGPDCSEFYADTTYQECDPELKPPCHTVTETAVAAFTAGADTNGFVFDGWAGCESPSGRTCTQTVAGDTSVTARFRDNQSPSVSTPSPGSGAQRGTIMLSASASDNAGVQRVEFKVGGVLVGSDTTAPYSVSWNTATVADGVKSLTATAVDLAGLTASSSASSITVDNTAPQVAVSGPDGEVFGPSSTQQWMITASDATSGVASVQCSLVSDTEEDSFRPCSGGTTSDEAADLPGADYRFAVRATDAAGNVTQVTRLFEVDTTAPQTRIASGPAKTVKTRHRKAKVHFKFAANETVASFLCKLDGKRWTSCSATPTFKVGRGKHVLRVESVDLVSNRDRTPATWRWTVKRKS